MASAQEQKFDKGTIPSVSIDGVRIRTLREKKKLTQLYIASVVGVTTDTISRWENNRYPTIKRDNAEKLAEALEVPLEEIIRTEELDEEPVAVAHPETETKRRPGWLVPLLLLLFVCGGVAAFYLLQDAPPAGTRFLPRHSAPGEIIPVQLKISRNESGARGLIIKEQLPVGWTLVKASPAPASGGVNTGEVKWLIPAGEGSVTISYTVRVPDRPPAEASALFGGRIGVHEGGITRSVTTAGSTGMTVDSCHWADVNCDGRIDDNEIMPAYYLTDEMKGLGLDWKTIEAIWSARGYTWDGVKREFVLVK